MLMSQWQQRVAAAELTAKLKLEEELSKAPDVLVVSAEKFQQLSTQHLFASGDVIIRRDQTVLDSEQFATHGRELAEQIVKGPGGLKIVANFFVQVRSTSNDRQSCAAVLGVTVLTPPLLLAPANGNYGTGASILLRMSPAMRQSIHQFSRERHLSMQQFCMAAIVKAMSSV